MGVSTEQWRFAIGIWRGGCTTNCVCRQSISGRKHDSEKRFKWMTFLILAALLLIGCVELNPGPKGQSKQERYTKRPGAVGLHGEKYGILVAALFFIRGLNNSEEFLIASNVEGAGAFDDLIFRYKLQDCGTWKTCFVQLKHKKNNKYCIQRESLTQMSGDFSLFKYFESFCRIKEDFDENDNLKCCGEFEEFEFVLYTNAEMKSRSSVKHCNNCSVGILSSGKKGEYISFDPTNDDDIYGFFRELRHYYELLLEAETVLNEGKDITVFVEEKLNDFDTSLESKEIKKKLLIIKTTPNKCTLQKLKNELGKCNFSLYTEFLQKFKLFHGQTGERYFDSITKSELSNFFKTSVSGSNYVYNKIEKTLTKWWDETGKVEWLSREFHVLGNLEHTLVRKMCNISRTELEEIKSHKLEFTMQHLNNLSGLIKDSNVLHVTTHKRFNTITKTKIYQALENLGISNSLYISLKSLLSFKDNAFKYWPCRWSKILVINCEQEFQYLDETVDSLMNSVRDLGCKIIVITPEEGNRLVSLFRDSLGDLILRHYKENCSFLDLDTESQNLLLEKPINFQGFDIPLKSLIGSNLSKAIKKMLDTEIISRLLFEKLRIGKLLNKSVDFYVSRTLKRCVDLNNNLLDVADHRHKFAISATENASKFEFNENSSSYRFSATENASKFEFNENSSSYRFKCANDTWDSKKLKECRIFVLENNNPKDAFNKLKELADNIHWIEIENNMISWKDSNGDMDAIYENINNERVRTINMVDVLDSKERILLLTDSPGMGRTTFFTYMANELKKRDPSIWILFLNLNEYVKLLENTAFELGNFREMLNNVALNSDENSLKLSRVLLWHAINDTGKIIIIIENFDEISPEFINKAERFMKRIRDTRASKICISCNSHSKLKLEQMFNTLAFNLAPFSDDDKISFFIKYWSQKSTDADVDNLQNFTKELLSASRNTDKIGQLIDVPLQMMMMAEIYISKAERYRPNGKTRLRDNFDLLALFKNFIKKKCHNCFHQRNFMTVSKYKEEREIISFERNYMVPALMSLFTEEELKHHSVIKDEQLQEAKKFLESEEVQRGGIILDFTNSRPRFVHRCFAEYFAAKWFVDDFSNLTEFTAKKLFEPQFHVLRYIFDLSLSGGSELHDAVVNKDADLVERLLEENTDINKEDRGGRTALHLAAAYNSGTIIKKLATTHNISKKDRVLQYTPKDYADKTESFIASDELSKMLIVLNKKNIQSSTKILHSTY